MLLLVAVGAQPIDCHRGPSQRAVESFRSAMERLASGRPVALPIGSEESVRLTPRPGLHGTSTPNGELAAQSLKAPYVALAWKETELELPQDGSQAGQALRNHLAALAPKVLSHCLDR